MSLSAAVASSILCTLPGPLDLPAQDDATCLRDEDGNGLDDAVETALAKCIAPEVRFDAREASRGKTEPRTLFNVRRVSNDRLRVMYVMLFEEDGGFQDGIICHGRTSHRGDTEKVYVDVAIEHDKAWVRAVDTGWPDGMHEKLRFSGTHPILFASAGKHHLYFDPYEGPFLKPYACRDLANGKGATVVAAPEHVPIFATSAPHGPPLTDDRSRWYNACLVRRHPSDRSAWRVAEHLRANRFAKEEDFAGEEIEGATFLGSAPSEVTPIWRTLAIAQPPWRPHKKAKAIAMRSVKTRTPPPPVQRASYPDPILPVADERRVTRARRAS